MNVFMRALNRLTRRCSNDNEGKYFTMGEAAEFCEVSMTTIRRAVQDNILIPKRGARRKYLFPVAQLVEYRQARSTAKA